MTKVLVDVDTPLIAELLERAVRRAGFTVVTGDRRGDSALDVVLLDIAAVDPGGRVVAAWLQRGVRVLAIGTSEEDERIGRALLQGASGFLALNDSTVLDVLAAIRQVAAGRASLHPAAAMAVLEQWRAMQHSSASIQLTQREQEVLASMAAGVPVKQLARQLGIAEKTVEAHRARLYSKLGVRSQAQAVAEAMRLGLLIH